MSGDDQQRSGGGARRRPTRPRRDPAAPAAGARDGRDAVDAREPAARRDEAERVERVERERRRAVRAEGRLAEIELVLRRAVERANGHGLSAPELRDLLESVHSRIVSLEEEVRAGERELLDIVAEQRRSLDEMSTGRAELAYGLEEARQELRDAVRGEGDGLTELARQRLEYEVELDRLQSLLGERAGVCDSLGDEIEEGARLAAAVAARLAELSRGRVAAPRRSLGDDARVAALRRSLESEQAELRQARRALEAARAELKVAQRGVVEVEEKAAGRLAPLEQRLRELEAERERLLAEVDASAARAAVEQARLQQALDRERAGRVQANEAVRVLERRLADLERQLAISGEEREERLRARVAESEKERERIEAERIRLAERVSLLQAAHAAQAAQAAHAARAAQGETAEGETGGAAGRPAAPEEGGAERRAKGKVVALLQERSGEEGDDAAATLRQRQGELDKLSERWRRLQTAYQEAVAEFDEVRAKRDRIGRLMQQLPPAGGAAAARPGAQASDPGAAAGPTAGPTTGPNPSPAGPEAVPPPAAGDAAWRVEESARRRPHLVQLDDLPELRAAVRDRAGRRGVAFHAVDAADALDAVATAGLGAVPPVGELCVAANLLAAAPAVLPALAHLARRTRVLRALLYAATGQRGRIFGAVDVFPAPFDAVVCATYLLGREPRLRRVMTVGEFADMMSRLRELLGRSRCSTAVAFDRRQAVDLVTLVQPEYVLIDLALSGGGALDLLLELGARSDVELQLGVTWSRPIAAEDLRAAAAARLAATPLDRQALAEAATAIALNSLLS